MATYPDLRLFDPKSSQPSPGMTPLRTRKEGKKHVPDGRKAVLTLHRVRPRLPFKKKFEHEAKSSNPSAGIGTLPEGLESSLLGGLWA